MGADQFRYMLLSCTLLLLSACSGTPEQVVQETQLRDAPTSGTPARGTSVADIEAQREELIRLEQAYTKALITKDRPFLESYYAPDYRGGNWMGFWTKSTMLKAVLDDRYSVRSMDVSQLNVKIVGTIGIVQGVSTEVTRINGKDTSGRWGFTDVFEFRGGRWVAIASHTSELKAE